MTSAVAEIKKVTTAIRSLGTRVSSNSKKIEASFSKVAASTTKAANAQKMLEKEAKRAESALIRESKALTTAKIKTGTLTDALKRAGATQTEINSAANAMSRFRREMKAGRGDAVALAAAQNKFALATAKSRGRVTELNSVLRKNATAKATKETKQFRDRMQDMTKSVTLALGPLSGVASRLTAFAGLVNKNTLAIAAFIGAMVGLSVVLFKGVKAGIAFEAQWLQIKFQLRNTRSEVTLTAHQINAMAEEIADATLTSAKETRKATGVLLSFSRITNENFAQTLGLAQDMSTIIGGDLVSNARRLARALEDPKRGIDALNRQLAILTPAEESVAKGLQEVQKSAEAAEFILNRLEFAIGGVARAAATGLAGALDTLQERMGRFLEQMTATEGILKPMTRVLNKYADALKDINDSGKLAANSGSTFARVVDFMAKSFEALLDNFDVVMVLFGTLLAGGILKKVGLGFFALATNIRKTSTAMGVLTAVMRVNPILLIATGVTAAFFAWKRWNSALDGTIPTLQELGAKIDATQKNLQKMQKTLKDAPTSMLGKFLNH